MQIELVKDAVMKGEPEKVKKTTEEAISAGISPIEILEKGYVAAIQVIGEEWRKGIAFISDVMRAGDSMKAGMRILKPKILEIGGKVQKLGTVVIGTVFGDIHNIGKDLVAVMLTVEGFDVIDLGVDVSVSKFIDKAEEVNADIIALSCLLSPSLYYQRDVIKYLSDMGVRDKYKIMVGGAPVTPDWVKEIGADGYVRNASDVGEVARLLVKGSEKVSLPIIKL